jgi:epoxyqueuosine reductase
MINQALRDRAKELGFIAIGFAKPRTPIHFDFFIRWIKDVEVGDMKYLKRNVSLRKDPKRLLDGVRTIISLAYPYSARKPSTSDGYATARYTTPQQADYHLRLSRLGEQLCKLIGQSFPGSRSRVCVDSAPVLERSFAVASGIGFTGKNNMLIVPGHGSYCFLVEILTTASYHVLPVEEMENSCGTCTKCIDACPTGALVAPFLIDVCRCLSYRTIEAKSDIDKRLGEKMGNNFFGCDVCQEVCHFNRDETPVISLPSADSIIHMDKGVFRKTFGNTPFERAGLEKLKSNIQALLNQ